MTGMVESATFRTERMRGAAEAGFATATDLADWLVREGGIPFREAHHITGRAVKRAEELGVSLDKVPLDELIAIDARIDQRVYGVLTQDQLWRHGAGQCACGDPCRARRRRAMKAVIGLALALLLVLWHVLVKWTGTRLVPTPYGVALMMWDFAFGGIYDDAFSSTLPIHFWKSVQR
eukprot:gene46033-62351_t